MSSTSMLSSSSSIHHHWNHGVSVFRTNSAMVSSRLWFSSPKKIKPLSIKSASSSSLSNSDFHCRRFLSQEIDGINTRSSTSSSSSLNAMMISGIIGNAQKWWEKGLQPNMNEIIGAQDLVDSLLNAGDKLVVVDFFSPSCGGCKALHPKICQFAEMNPDVQFLHVNYEEHKSMCYSLNVHVLPFFRFYRGAQGRVCSFSCTNATLILKHCDDDDDDDDVTDKEIQRCFGKAQHRPLQPGTTKRARGERAASTCRQQRSPVQFHAEARSTNACYSTRRDSSRSNTIACFSFRARASGISSSPSPSPTSFDN